MSVILPNNETRWCPCTRLWSLVEHLGTLLFWPCTCAYFIILILLGKKLQSCADGNAIITFLVVVLLLLAILGRIIHHYFYEAKSLPNGCGLITFMIMIGFLIPLMVDRSKRDPCPEDTQRSAASTFLTGLIILAIVGCYWIGRMADFCDTRAMGTVAEAQQADEEQNKKDLEKQMPKKEEDDDEDEEDEED